VSDLWQEEAALRALSYAYAAAVDERDGDRFAALFLPDGELVAPDVRGDLSPTFGRQGRDRLRQVLDGLDRYRHTFHEVTTTRYDVGEETASGRIWCTAHHVTADETDRVPPSGTDTVWGIRYADDYRRTPEGWRIARRVLHLLWVAESPVVQIGPRPGSSTRDR
jgi:ketosteroid isomerase-like protein